MPALIPRKPAPGLEVPTIDGKTWALAERKPENFTMLVFYRGLHCPVCANYMRDIDGKLDSFQALGVEVIAISTDDEERASATPEKWGLENIVIGHSLSIERAREWGLYVSSSRGKTSAGIEEPTLFNEPGLFLVRPDGVLYAAVTGSMPFARPHFSDVLKSLEFIIEKSYPARGEA